MLSLMLGATVYTFSIILAVFLAGLGIGSSAGAMWARSLKRPAIALGVLQLLLAGAIGWTAYAISDSLPRWPIDPTLVPNPWFMFQIDLMRVIWAILPPALFWGASFPVALAAVATRGKDPGKLVGGVYAANTVGAIFGSLMFSMIFIPADHIGTQGSERILIGIAAVSAFIALFPSLLAGFAPSPDEVEPTPLFVVIPSAVFLLAGLFGAAYLAFSVQKMPDSSVAYGRLIWTAEDYKKDFNGNSYPVYFGDDGREYKYVGEGMNVSVAVTEQNGIRYFHGAGKVQASSDPQDMRLQRMLGHLSALIATQHHDVLVVACGAGVTAGSFVPYPDVNHITIVDIEKKVPENVAHAWFKDQNYDVVRDPRTTVICDDGRHFVRTTKQKFDIITSDPIDPWVKGCAALNTVEYYQMCLQHLNPGGVMSLWIPLYENNETSVKSIISTFMQVFPDGIVFSNDEKGEGYDAVLLGQCGDESGKPGPTHVDLDKLQNLLDTADYARVKQSLEDVYFGQIGNGADVGADLMSTFAVQGGDLKEWVEDKNINYDRNLRLQFLSGLYLNTHDEVGILDRMLNYYHFPSNIFTGSEGRLTELQHALDTLGRSRFAKSPLNTIPLPSAPVESKPTPMPPEPASRPATQP
jgi:spermidine synthase